MIEFVQCILDYKFAFISFPGFPSGVLLIVVHLIFILRAILQESEAKLEMKIFNPPSFFVWR